MTKTAPHAIALSLSLLLSCKDQVSREEVASGKTGLLEDARSGVPVRNLPDPPPAPPAPSQDGLLPLSRSDIERSLPSGAGCALDDNSRGPLLAAVAEGAIINDGGSIVRLKPEALNLQSLSEGGRFVANGLVVEVRRGQPLERDDEVTTWDATLSVIRGRIGFLSYHHRWTCGA